MKYTLITGASSGIGLALAEVYAEKQHGLILVSSNSEKLEKAAKKITAIASKPVYTFCKDLSVLGAAEDLFQEVKDAGLKVDFLINNAGFGLVGATEEIDLLQDEKMMILNMLSSTKLTKLFLPDMYEENTGCILNVASTGAFQPGPFTATYFASKSFVDAYSRGIAYEARKSGVKIATLYPGATATEFFKREGVNVPRSALSPEKVADYTYKQLQKGKAIIIPGWINKVQRLLPKPVKMRILGKIKKQQLDSVCEIIK